MKTYLLEGCFSENRPTGPAFQALLEQHHAYLSKYLQDGSILLSGPVKSRSDGAGGGGIIVIKSEDIHAFCAADPFVVGGVQTYRILEFQLFDGLTAAKDWATKPRES